MSTSRKLPSLFRFASSALRRACKVFAMTLMSASVLFYAGGAVAQSGDDNAKGDEPAAASNTTVSAGAANEAAMLPASASQHSFISFGWKKECPQASTALNGCMLSITVYTPESDPSKRFRLASYGLQFDENGNPASQVMLTPLGTMLRRGVSLQLDNAAGVIAPYTLCNTQGCTALWPADDVTFERLKQGQTLSLAYSDLSDVQTQFRLPLSGLADVAASRGVPTSRQ